MNENDKPCLQLRNQTSRSEETYCKIYTKKFRGYVRSAFINHQTVGLFLGSIALLLLCIFTPNDKDEFATYIKWTLFGFFVFSYLCIITLELWFWKYAKYVVVTNEGIWIMWHGLFWRKTDFTGKRRFASPIWSVYDWCGIKITADDKVRPRSADKSLNIFDDFDYAVVKSTHLSSLFLTRFDGVQEINFLDGADANEILAYAKEQHKRKKRKKKDMEIIEEEYDKLPDEEYIDGDEE